MQHMLRWRVIKGNTHTLKRVIKGDIHTHTHKSKHIKHDALRYILL